MVKLCSLSRHTTSLLSGIADLECKLVKNASQRVESLFTGAEIVADFPAIYARFVDQTTLEPLAIL
jgi:hypothetical protein